MTYDPVETWRARIERGGFAPWLDATALRLQDAPNPEHARLFVAETLAALETSAPTDLRALQAAAVDTSCDVLFALHAIAPFSARRVRTHPGWIQALVQDDLHVPRDRDTLDACLRAALTAERAAGGSAAAALRKFKYFELARIIVRDVSPRLVPLQDSDVTLAELTALADILLEHSTRLAAQDVHRRFGPPRWQLSDGTRTELSFAVLGLGKLGGEELNFSSDVDLVYVYEAPADAIEYVDAVDLARASPQDYFTRVAQRLGALVSEMLPEGFLYRIDLGLRPEGAQGSLVVSHEALAVYYESVADTWELAAFAKARPVAGDRAFGERAIAEVAPMIFRSSMDFSAVDAIRGLKAKIEAAHHSSSDAFDVKLHDGGIRDIEFIAQAMQLLHGGRIEQIRARGTVDTLERLQEVRLLSADRVHGLLTAYRYLRRLENRLQMVAERQTHTLPREPAALRALARTMGHLVPEPVAAFNAELLQVRGTVRSVFNDFFFERGAERIFDVLVHALPQMLATTVNRNLLHELSKQFAVTLDVSADPQRALNNLDRFARAISGRRFYLELLLDRPELVPRLTALFASSNFLSAILATHPALIEPVFHDPNVLLLSQAQLEQDFAAILRRCRAGDVGEETESEFDALRLFYYRQVLNVGLLGLSETVSRARTEAALTAIAEVCIEQALELSRIWILRRRPALADVAQATQFVVVGMGKLASYELTYGSDLDLLFVLDINPGSPAGRAATIDPLDVHEYCTRLSQRLIHMLSTKTAQGSCYDVDERLRPSGRQGTLVTSLSAFERYHKGAAQVWERMALLRARPICGDSLLSQRFRAVRRAILLEPLPPEARDELHHMRQRAERELACETSGHVQLKHGRGGVLDIENVVHWLCLQHAAAHPELLDVAPVASTLERLRTLGLVTAKDGQTLSRGWDFLQRVSNRMRVVENRSVADLDLERGDLDSLARSLGYIADGRERVERRRLLADYRAHTTAIRAVYTQLFGK